jgi:predicted permease
LRNVLVVGEIALSLILLVVASLFVRSFLNLLQAEDAFDTSRLTALRFEMPEGRYDSAGAIVRRVDDVVARLEALPGVESVSASNLIPLRGGGRRTTAILEGKDTQVGGALTVLYGGVTSRFFETLDVPLLHGRSFTEVEARTRSAVAIINGRMADRLWRGQDALGRRFRLAADSSGVWFTVVGVSRDISNWNLSHRPLPTAYLPYPHVPVRDPRLVIRTAGDTVFTDGPARTAIHAADSALLVFGLESMDEVHRLAFWRQELLGLLFTIFGAIAMLLAAVGVYGVLSYLVSQRTREIGVRLALGAERRHVVRLIVWQGMALVLAGVALGLAGAFAATRIIRRQLYEVSATDPVSFAGVALVLAGVGLVASYAPAYRAAALDPIASLRD